MKRKLRERVCFVNRREDGNQKRKCGNAEILKNGRRTGYTEPSRSAGPQRARRKTGLRIPVE